MAEYIEREATKKEFNIHFGDVHDAVIANRLIDSTPAADVAPVVHGRWKDKQTNSIFTWHLECSVCGSDYHTSVGYNYCPNCGAKMDGERRSDGKG